ncbi:hypothetical protein TGVAND_264875 [Toxoplasma gondii VAND]|uniref:Uncharacterized protein n=1 Tax=Toxoplasma gondii VAND TaxID=933077 RepID=A0A086PM03_TOXGO|nr:hypothetical protein TGVAND_264875 [Toxoplasma gondii VAND]
MQFKLVEQNSKVLPQRRKQRVKRDATDSPNHDLRSRSFSSHFAACGSAVSFDSRAALRSVSVMTHATESGPGKSGDSRRKLKLKPLRQTLPTAHHDDWQLAGVVR